MDADNLSKSWKSWRDQFNLYLELTMSDAEEKMKVKLFYYLIGESGRELLETLMSDVAADARTVTNIIAKFDEHCNPSINETVERYRFFSKSQGAEQSIDNYVTELRMLAKTCNFGEIKDSLIRDRIVCGINNEGLRERLLREKDLTLQTCIRICRAAELSRQNSKAIAGAAVEEVHAVRQGARLDRHPPGSMITCRFCGKDHEKNKQKCPAFGKKCKKCGKPNHFAVKCRAQLRQGNHKSVNKVTEQDSDEYEDILTVGVANPETVKKKEEENEKKTQLYAGMLLGKDLVKFQIDCGASCNVIPISLLSPDIKLEDTKTVLIMYNQSKVRPLGKCKLKVRNPRNHKLYRLEFQVVDNNCTVPLIGKRASEAMKLIKVHYENILAIDSIVTTEKPATSQWSLEQIKTEYADVFRGDGCLEGEYKIEIDNTVKPVQLPKRRVPVAMMKPLKEELQDLQRRGIIVPVERSTNWISSMVVVQKPSGSLRVCIDPRPLNRALKRSHFPLPTIDDILPELSKAKVFTVCDVKSGFWHVKLEEDSSYLTTFSSPFGRYRWLRMPMGISPAPEIFQRKLTVALEGLPGVYIIADDVLITGQGETQESAERDHDEKLKAFLARCREKGIKLNADKFKLRQREVSYIGHLLTSDGLKIDPDKVRAITHMQKPTDVKAVQRLLGMVNYLSKFCAHLSDQCEALRQLTHKNCEWRWTAQHEEAFCKIKETIANAPVLKYYNPDEELTIQCDASEGGLGAALMQGGKPVAFTSRALTQTERGYAQIEKELLALLFGMEKFHHYTYGRKVAAQSDHKPLENILRKPLLSAPKRLQRMMLRLQKYDVEVVYVPGPEMWLADTLSRAYLPESTPRGDVEAELETINMTQHVPISADRFGSIRSATEKDKTLQTLIKTILQGWPKNKADTPKEIGHYYLFQEELSYQDGIVFRGERAVIPKQLWREITQCIHSSHLGVDGCLRRARECVYWQGMNEQIKSHVQQCDTCHAVDCNQQKETLRPHEMPDRPWAKVGTDLFTFDNKDYLITVDYYSNFWEIDYLTDTKSTTVIRKLKGHFARQGIPDIVISDNGPQFSSQEFQKFSDHWAFLHKTSSPGYPQSNGKAESAVKTAKRLMRKAQMSRQDPYLAILDHRNTPTHGLSTSPAQRLLSRHTKTLLPTKTSLLQPKIQNSLKELITNQQRQQTYYDRSAKDLDTLKRGDPVRIQPFEPHKIWRKGTVVEPIDSRSYNVQLESGGVIRRNRRHLRRDQGMTLRVSNQTETVVADNTEHTGTADSQSQTSNNVENQMQNTKQTDIPASNVTKAGRLIKKPQYLKYYITS